MSEKIHIVLVSDANYLPGLEVTKATMLRSSSASERLVWHVFDETALKGVPGVAELPKWNNSLMPYLRLWLPLLLPDVDRVVYSDVDTIWMRDVCELWDGGTENSSIYWVRDLRSTVQMASPWLERVAAEEGLDFDRSKYACSGVCVLNLKKMRETRFTERVAELFRKHGVPNYPDQDALNLLLGSDSELLPSVWNAMGDCSNLPPAEERCVYHITGIGRHFHSETPPTYPPQYQFWWNVWMREMKLDIGDLVLGIRCWVLGRMWPFRWVAWLLPLRLRERVMRQWFFARVFWLRERYRFNGGSK